MMKLVPRLAALSAVFLLALAGGTVAYAAPVTSSNVSSGSPSSAADNTTSSGSQASVPPDDNPASIPTDSAVSPGDSVSTTSGTGTVIASSTNGGKQFYTIQTPAGNTFYLIIDLNQQTNNVYFLDDVTEKDLLALATKSDNGAATDTESVNPVPGAASTVSQPAVSSPSPASANTATKSSGPNFSMILLVLIILGGGGALFYIKVYRPKHQNDSRDEYEEDDEAEKPDTRDEDDYSDDDDYEAEQEEDTESADDET